MQMHMKLSACHRTSAAGLSRAGFRVSRGDKVFLCFRTTRCPDQIHEFSPNGIPSFCSSGLASTLTSCPWEAQAPKSCTSPR